MRTSYPLFLILIVIGLSACVASGNNDALQSAAKPAPASTAVASAEQPSTPDTTSDAPLSFGEANQQGGLDTSRNVFASEPDVVAPALRPRNKKTYLINGLASSVESIGYGFTNLSKKIPGSVLHNYASFVESSTIIRAKVTRELKAAYRRDPNVEINLIGISFGANIVTLIAADLDRAKIPVNYLVTMEGPAMVPINDNVRIADNFSCTNLDCFRTKSRLAWGNRSTDFSTFKIKTSHIPLANHNDVHNRILAQIARPTAPPLVAVQ